MSEHKNSSKLILDLGCGNKKREGTVGVDYNTRLDGDVNHDLNTFPYPFQAGSVDKIYIDNCIEHLDSPLHVMEEIHRILKKGGEVKVIVPYFRSPSAFHDPTHKTFYTTESFSYYDPDHPICKRYDYTKAYFKVENFKMISDDYDVAISSQKISHFINRNKKVQYWIALEPDSEF